MTSPDWVKRDQTEVTIKLMMKREVWCVRVSLSPLQPRDQSGARQYTHSSTNHQLLMPTNQELLLLLSCSYAFDTMHSFVAVVVK